MGCFDRFEMSGIRCPKRHKMCTEFQTKSVGEMLNTYHRNKKVVFTGLVIEKGSVTVYNFCDICDRMYYWKAIIKNKRFIGLKSDRKTNYAESLYLKNYIRFNLDLS